MTSFLLWPHFYHSPYPTTNLFQPSYISILAVLGMIKHTSLLGHLPLPIKTFLQIAIGSLLFSIRFLLKLCLICLLSKIASTLPPNPPDLPYLLGFCWFVCFFIFTTWQFVYCFLSALKWLLHENSFFFLRTILLTALSTQPYQVCK